VALKNSIALLPEDRKQQGVIMGMCIEHNISFAILDRLSRFAVIKKRQEKDICNKLVADLSIKISSLLQPVMNLSGGNQQKVVLAKCLATECNVLFIDEPTRGIDVGAKQEIYKIMRQLADNGTSIIMVSSEMSELIGMSDRIIVMKEGQVVKELMPEEYSQELILNYAAL
jgi:ribose transport system ATP-binding protein